MLVWAKPPRQDRDMPAMPRRFVLSLPLVLAFACGDAGGDEGGGETGSTGGNLPAWCAPTAGWSSASAQWEAEVLDIVNARRAEGADCGSEGSFGPADPLTAQANLQCAARMHSLDMEERNFNMHTNPDGEGPGERVGYAEYDWSTWGENIAWGYPDPAAVMAGWMSSDGHCSNIMNPAFVHLGVGHYGANQWTQVFGAPR